MKNLLTILNLIIFMSSHIYGQMQITDSTKVKQISYDSDTKDNRYVIVSEQQLKAKPDYEMGYFLVGNHEFEKAIKSLKKAIDIDSTGNCGTGKDGMAYSELGYAYTRLGDFVNARIYLDKAIEKNKLLPEPYLSKSVLLMQKGNNDLALETLNSLIENIPSYAIGYAQRGFMYDSENEYRLALKDFNKFLEVVKEQNQAGSSRAMVEDIKKRKAELENKINQ